MSSKRPYSITNESGFTLIEIIAVMVIMSILAVVAVPKYFNLQDEARQKAMETAVAEGVSRINGYFAKQILSGTVPSTISYDTTDATVATDIGTNMGDFTLAVAQGSAGQNDGDCANSGPFPEQGCLQITVTGTGAQVSGQTEVKQIPIPGAL